jgi:cytochrome oxidase Cu insertion factor (SCO1/SenC/PrrC family)
MNKATVYILLLVVVLIVGLALGYGGARLFGPARPGEVRNAELQVGDKAPDFRLPDHTGGYVRLSDFQGKKNVVIAFYPLAWTPV